MRKVINEHNLPKEEIELLPIHRKVKAVIFNEDNTLICVEEDNKREYLLGLPGGGLENGENDIQGLKREVKEETGYDITNITHFGVIELVRAKYLSVTNCYTARTKGSKDSLKLTDEEIAVKTSSLEISFKEALKRITEEYSKNPNNNSLRSLLMLKEVENY